MLRKLYSKEIIGVIVVVVSVMIVIAARRWPGWRVSSKKLVLVFCVVLVVLLFDVVTGDVVLLCLLSCLLSVRSAGNSR